MLQKKLIYLLLLLLIISSWVVGFYCGRKSETDKKINLLYSLSHAELMVDSIEMVDAAQIDELREELIKALDSSLFPVFYEFSLEVNKQNRRHMLAAVKVINKADEVLLREDADYLPEIRTDSQSRNEYYNYIKDGLGAIRKFNSEDD